MLRYLFIALFSDGTKITQNQEDKSLLIEGKNQYYDVLQSGKKLVSFTIREQKIWNPTEVNVNLISGIITVNGVELYHEEPNSEDKELYWNMNVIQTMSVQAKNGHVFKLTPLPEQRTYFVGWKSKTRQQIIGVK